MNIFVNNCNILRICFSFCKKNQSPLLLPPKIDANSLIFISYRYLVLMHTKRCPQLTCYEGHFMADIFLGLSALQSLGQRFGVELVTTMRAHKPPILLRAFLGN